MAKKGAGTWIILFICLFFISFCASNGEDLKLLLSFKGSINDPLRVLSNWNSSLSYCQWYGITCTNSSRAVTGIELSGKNITGVISAGSLFKLPSVETINLSNNQLSGKIPSDIFSCSTLRYLNLSNNNLSGSIPSGFLRHLEIFDLSNNLLSGNIPEDIGLFSKLEVLDLGGNVLDGVIPKSIINVTSLQFLTLASNQLTGEIHRELGLMKSLNWIYLGYNNLSGTIPKEIGELTSLNHLDLVYNNLTGEIPPSLGNLTNLRYLFLYQNKLTGSIPRSIFNLKKLVSLDLSDNSLSGQIPEHLIQLQNLEILQLFSNNFTGRIPQALTSMPRLQVIQLWSNKLSGKIPTTLGKQNNLTILDLSTNNLTGKIPESLCTSGHLFKLILFSNSLEGDIPKSLSYCKSLRRIRIQDNRLTGVLSAEFIQLPLVYFLDISGNNFTGRISGPGQTWKMPLLEMLDLARNQFWGELPETFGGKKIQKMDLSQNRFSGTIPSSFGSLSEIVQLKISQNNLNGKIPEELSWCKKLVSLDLSHNQLSGKIPSSLSEMSVLGQLDLSENQLSGEIPSNLGKVESLVQVNISHNHFHGSLPSTGAFLTINSSSVAGNNLCGGHTTTGLPPCKRVERFPAWWILVMCLLVVLVVLVISAFVLVFIRRGKRLQAFHRAHSVHKRVGNEDGEWEMQFFNSNVLESITIDDILSSTQEENVISRGNKCILYKGKSNITHMQFLIEGLNHMNSVAPSFLTEMSGFGKLQHRNIAKINGICRSEKGAGYLIYEFINGKNLSEVLRNLNWERRRKIANGIAKALQYLHCHRSPRVLAGDMSPEKVIVDENDEPHLRLSFPGLLCTEVKSFISSAPETRETKDITEKTDIYGFGLILIEILTGKGPANAEFGAHNNIVEWARYCYSDCHLELWIDATIKEYASNIHNELVETMNIALHCTAGDPAARPCITEICKTLESIMRRSSCVSGIKIFSSRT